MAVRDLVESAFGAQLRTWRRERRLSQLELALAADASARHLSFLETGRAAPSRELVLRLAETLELSLRARNDLLLAAGYAPMFRETALAEPIMAEARRALEHIMAQQEPYPAMVLDRGWNIVMRNGAGPRLAQALFDPEDLAAAGPDAGNAMKMMFHPRLYRRFTENWEEVAGEMLRRLRQEAAAAVGGDPARRLVAEMARYDLPRAPARATPAGAPVLGALMRKGGLRLAIFSTYTSFGTPQDVTLQELRIKCSFPADEATAAWFRAKAERSA